MERFILRLAAIAMIPSILHPAPAQCAPAHAPAELRMDHISITEMGKGSPIILIPGLSSPRAVWDGVAPTLARTHRVILVQVNGFGGDDAGPNLKPGVLDGIVVDLHAYIAKNRLKDAAVVGHSMGGLVALMLAKAHPGDAAKLMIVDSLPWYGMLFGPSATLAAVEPRAKAMRDQMAAAYGKPANPAVAARIATTLALKPASQALVRTWVEAADPRVSAEAMYEDLMTDLRPDLPAIRTPITMVYPWNAGGPTRDQADSLYKAAYGTAPDVTFVAIGDAAHFVMLDQPDAFLKAIVAFAG